MIHKPEHRRALLSVLVGVTTFLSTLAMAAVLRLNGITTAECLLLVLFTLSSAWIALSFWTHVLGFFAIRRTWKTSPLAVPPEDLPLAGTTCVVMPIRDEDVGPIFGNLEAMMQGCAEAGEHFDFFVLSDSSTLEAWLAEESSWYVLRQRTQAYGRVFYRRRPEAKAKKSGNIADFCEQFGSAYDAMIVLDADSLMSGNTLVSLHRTMAYNPRAGLIQTAPRLFNRRSLFARALAFASASYGPMQARGLAFWQLGESNFWGHNAIIRVSAFMKHCGLPVLPGKPPMGGLILSHDFVEAALLVRAGYTVSMAAELGGSYEEAPPHLLAYAARDRRWCQGNLQHLGLLATAGLRGASRWHLLAGALSYLASPLWLLFLAIGMVVTGEALSVRPTYFPEHKMLFPAWPIFDSATALQLLVWASLMLFGPKFLALFLQRDRPFSRAASTCAEIGLSMLLAPTMMLLQTGFVGSVLLGMPVGWLPQQRDDAPPSWRETARALLPVTLIGAGGAAGTFFLSPSLLLWMAPVYLGLLLAIPLSVLSASTRVGDAVFARGLFHTPEDDAPPAVMLRARAIMQEGVYASVGDGLARLRDDAHLAALHLALLAEPPPLAVQRAEAAVHKWHAQGAQTLTRNERLALASTHASVSRWRRATADIDKARSR
jgi:membrane glycosyltransferase